MTTLRTSVSWLHSANSLTGEIARARMKFTMLASTTISPTQNGKKPDFGPSSPQPMPTCRLPTMVIAPRAITNRATPISTLRCRGPGEPEACGEFDIDGSR